MRQDLPPLDLRPVHDEAEWRLARALRTRVFVQEQSCAPEEEWDEHDATATHLLGWQGGEAVAVSRWREVDAMGQRWAKLERFAVPPERRGEGLGKAMIAATIAHARAAGHVRFMLHAQSHLRALYEGFGFVAVGGIFMEAGIPHYKMLRAAPGDAPTPGGA